jgi:hypothetical protein
MNFYMKSLIFAAGVVYAAQFPGVWYADAQKSNINGVYTVFKDKHYANCTSSFLCTGPNWGTNGE